MEYKIGDTVEITAKDGMSSICTVTEIDDDGPVTKYKVTTLNGKVSYWKNTDQLRLSPHSIKSVPVAKKRGRPKGTGAPTKKNAAQKVQVQDKTTIAEESLEPVSNPVFEERYYEFISSLSLEEFFELHKLINLDYEELLSLAKNLFELKFGGNS